MYTLQLCIHSLVNALKAPKAPKNGTSAFTKEKRSDTSSFDSQPKRRTSFRSKIANQKQSHPCLRYIPNGYHHRSSPPETKEKSMLVCVLANPGRRPLPLPTPKKSHLCNTTLPDKHGRSGVSISHPSFLVIFALPNRGDKPRRC